MVVCCICGIEWVPESVSFHKFPKSDNIKKRWLAAINKKIMNFTLSTNSRICGQHFTIECFIITESGRRYLKSYAVPSIFNMPLKKKYILTQPIQTNECDIVSSNDELCSETTTYVNEVIEDNLQESCVFINNNQDLIELNTVYSDVLDISAINKEEINKDQQIHNENYEIIANNNHEKLYSKVMNVNNNNRINLHKSHGSTTRRRRITNGILDISLVNKRLVDAQYAMEESNEILRKKLKTSQQKCRRLQRKVTFLSLLIKHLQNKRLSQNNIKS